MTTRCPTCGCERTCTESNGADTTTIEVPTALLASLVHTMSIAHNTALMCGEKEAQEIYADLERLVSAMVPPEAARFHDGSWTAFLLRVGAGGTIEVATRHEPGWSGGWKVALTDPSGTPWPRGVFREANVTVSETLATEAEAEKLAAAVREIARRHAPMPE